MLASNPINDAGFRVVNFASAVVEIINRDRNIFDTFEDRKDFPKIAFADISYHIPFGNHADGGRAFVFAFFQRSVNAYAFAIPVKRRECWVLSCKIGGLSVEYKVPKDICADEEELRAYVQAEELF